YDKQHNVYLCPGGKLLTSTGNIDQGRILYYRALRSDCSACTLKPQCTIGPVRKVTRDIDEEVRDRVRALADTEAFKQSMSRVTLRTGPMVHWGFSVQA